jgi:hypothetical protein
MAYTHSKYSVDMTCSLGGDMQLTSDLDLLSWACPYPPHIIRRVGVIFGSSGDTASDFALSIRTATTPTNNTLTTIGTINGGGNGNGGRVMLTSDLQVELTPGHNVSIGVTSGGVTNAKVFLYVEPRWETVTNITNTIVTT